MKRREKPSGKDCNNNDKATSPPVSPKQATSPASNNSHRKKMTTSTAAETLAARRSTRVAADKYTHDGDSWQETLAVCEMPAIKSGEVKMKIRSYYSNKRTGDRVWDEPPSGASRVLPATEEMRKMAELQLEEMQITFGTALNEQPKENGNKRRTSLGLFKKRTKASPSTTTADSNVYSPKYKVKYKPGSILSGIKKKPPQKVRQHDDSLDPEVQKAIALSMNTSATSIAGEEPVIRSEVSFRDDEFDMVMAMSLSEAEFQKKNNNNNMSEEEMLQRALVESRRSTSTPTVAALPIKDEFSGLGLSQSSSSEETRRKGRASDKYVVPTTRSDDSSLDKKMPAKPSKSSSSSTVKEAAVVPSSESDQKLPGTNGDSKRRSSRQSASSDGDKERKEAAVTRDSKSRSSRSMSSGGSRSSRSSLSNVKGDAKSAQSLSSGSSRSSLTNGRSDRSSDSKAPMKPSAAKYGKSLRPTSSKNLAIARTPSSESRSSFHSAREQATSKRAANDSSLKPSTKDFSPYGDPIVLVPKGVSVKEDAKTRSQRSLFAASSKKVVDKESARSGTKAGKS